MKPQHKPRFDWKKARRLRAEGLSYVAIASRLGVSEAAVYRICKEGARERANARSAAWVRNGICPFCGAQATRAGGQSLCRDCDNKRRATSVRETELRCVTCHEWKPDDAFPFNRAGKKLHRGRHSSCRACLTVLRADYRVRNREKERAYERTYRRRRRLAKMTPLQRPTSRFGQEAA
jgi:hypothetical protein